MRRFCNYVYSLAVEGLDEEKRRALDAELAAPLAVPVRAGGRWAKKAPAWWREAAGPGGVPR